MERFRDELGDWRVCILTPFGGRVHAPWSLALEARLGERLGAEVQTIWTDDGIAIRLPEGDLGDVDDLLFPDPDEIEDLVVAQVANSALFAARFRENAARALLLPRRRPGTRTPLWQQRQRAADLLAVASRVRLVPDPRRDLPRVPLGRVRPAGAARGAGRRRAARDRGPRGRDVRAYARSRARCSSTTSRVHVRGRRAAGRAPGAGAHARSRPAARAARPGGAARAARSGGARRPRAGAAGAGRRSPRDHRRPGPRPAAPARRPVARRDRGARRGRHGRRRRWLADLERAPAPVRSGSPAAPAGSRSRTSRATATRSASQPPSGVPAAFLVPDLRGARGTARPLGADAWAVPAAGAGAPLGPAGRRRRGRAERLLARGSLVRGEFRPGGAEREWCDPEVLRQLRRRSLARLRREVEPVEPAALARFLPGWQGVPRPARAAAAARDRPR